MIHEVRVKFQTFQPLIFYRSEDVRNYNINQEYSLLLLADRHSIKLLLDDQNILCKLPNTLLAVNEKIHYTTDITLLKKAKSKGGEHDEIITITGSKICIHEIFQLLRSQRKTKNCLGFTPSRVQHISILSGQSPTQKFRGFMNLIGIMFMVLNLRNIIDNFYKHGVQFKSSPQNYISLETMISSGCLYLFVLFAYVIEQFKFRNILNKKVAMILLTGNLILLMLFNFIYCQKFNPAPLPAIVFTALTIIIEAKLISFMQVNSELFTIFEKLKSKTKKQKIKFAEEVISGSNLKYLQMHDYNWNKAVPLSNLAYFMLAPTLCYQLEYPRTQSIRYVWLTRRVFQLIMVTGLQTILWLQYIQPELKSLFQANQNSKNSLSYLELFNRHLRLSVPNTIMWISGFYGFFHLSLNIVAQLLYYGDRNFYKDWWNCRSLEEYWKTWNLPVHFWFIRHVYNPLLAKGFSKLSANLVVFFISAILHEYVVSVPLGLISYYAFLAMLMQAPAIFIQKKLDKLLGIENSELGNGSFWIFFCLIGQPLLVYIYYSTYMNKMNSGGGGITSAIGLQL